MIHQLLNLTRPLIVLDTETTGLDPQSARVIEMGFQIWEPEKGLASEWQSLINPGIEIPFTTSKIHGIYDLDMSRCQVCQLVIDDVAPDRCRCEKPRRPPFFRDIAPKIARGFSNCDFAGKRVRFDLQMVEAEMKRAGVVWSYAEARIVDADRLEALAVPRSLRHLHEKYVGLPHDTAHRALSDVRATTTVIVKQLETHASLSRDLDKLHIDQWGLILDTEGKFKMVDGIATCQFGKYRGKAMRDIPVDYLDWLISSNFPDDVKRLAADAKLGKYPGEETNNA